MDRGGGVVSDDIYSRPNVRQRDDGRWEFRASSLGSCDRALVMEALGQTPEPPPEHVQKGMDEGTASEHLILGHDKIDRAGLSVCEKIETLEQFATDVHVGRDGGAQMYLELPVGPAIITCHPDALFVGTRGDDIGQFYVGEAKFLRGGWKKLLTEMWKQRPSYAWQLSVQMAGTGLPAVYMIGDKGPDGELVDVRVDRVTIPPYSKAQIAKRVLGLVKLIEAGTIPDCTYAQYPCGFWRDGHDGQKVWAKDERVLEVDIALGKKIQAQALKYTRHKDEERFAKKQKDMAKDALMELLEQAGDGDPAGVVQYGGVRVVGHVEDVAGGTFERKAYTKRYVDVKIVG